MSLRDETGWRAFVHRISTRLYGPSPSTTWLSWIGDERLAVGNLPTPRTLARLPDEGVTHVVNCRFRAQTWFSQDLAMERAVFPPAQVRHAPMWDNGRPKGPERFEGAVLFAIEALHEDPSTACSSTASRAGAGQSNAGCAGAGAELRGAGPVDSAVLTRRGVRASHGRPREDHEE